MQYVSLGRTGVRVSPLCLGTMTFGGESDAAASAEMYEACRSAGLNFFDCANTYQSGRSEEVLGGLIAPHRDEVIITTKCYNATGNRLSATVLCDLARQALSRCLSASWVHGHRQDLVD